MKSLKIPEAVNQRRKKDRQYSGQKKKEEGQTIQRPKEEGRRTDNTADKRRRTKGQTIQRPKEEGRRTDNTAAKRRRTKGKPTICKPLHDRTTRIPLKDGSVLRKGKQFLFHLSHPLCFSCYKPGDKS
jgi:hypothetical protein